MRVFPSTTGMVSASARHPWRVLGIWAVALVLAAVLTATSLSKTLTTDVSFTNNPESLQGSRLLADRLRGASPVTETVVVHSDSLTINDPQFQAVVEQTTQKLASMTGVVSSAANYYEARALNSPKAQALVSADGHSTIIPVTLVGSLNQAKNYGAQFVSAVEQNSQGNIQVTTVGQVSIDNAFTQISSTDLRKAEYFGLPAAVIVLVLVFGALVAAGIPLALAGFSIVVALGLTTLLGRVTDLSFYVVNMITMIGLAVGIDYALFLISRFREERGIGKSVQEAIAVTGGTAGKAVLFSGATVALALSGIIFMPTTIFRSLGAGAVMVVLVAMFAIITLVPVALRLIGNWINWPRRTQSHPVQHADPSVRWSDDELYSGFWGRASRAIMTHPVVSLVLAATLLVTLATPLFQLKRGMEGVSTLPPGTVRTAFNILNRDFAAGLLAPVEIVVDAPRNDQTLQAITKLNTTLANDPQFVPTPSVEWNSSGDLALVSIPLKTDPNSPSAYATVKQLRSSFIPAAFAGTNARVYVTGQTALNVDFVSLVDSYTPWIFAYVLSLSFVLLTLAFRSIVVPAKAILMNLLSVGAAYGLMVLVFQKGYLHNLFHFEKTPTIEAWVPIFLFTVLFGLSMDYQVFLLSRIREHFDQTHDNRESVAVGLKTTGRLITGAASIMVVVFASFASGRLVVFEQLGFGLAVAIALDATVVRLVLVPAAMTLLGDINWYLPKWLEWLPDLRVEGDVARSETPERELVGVGGRDDARAL